jgi:hypothetical protein
MRAETAAAYCDEVSVEAFQSRVGTVYPVGHNVPGRGRVWVKEELDLVLAPADRNAGGKSLAQLL